MYFAKLLLFHTFTIILVLFNYIIKPTIIYFIASFISVLITLFLHIGILLEKEGIDKTSFVFVINQFKNNNIILTVLSTIVCFLVGLYYLEKSSRKDGFTLILWIAVIVVCVLITILTLENNLLISIFPNEIYYWVTYPLLFIVFLLTIYVKTNLKELKDVYKNQLFAIQNKSFHRSEYNGDEIEL